MPSTTCTSAQWESSVPFGRMLSPNEFGKNNEGLAPSPLTAARPASLVPSRSVILDPDPTLRYGVQAPRPTHGSRRCVRRPLAFAQLLSPVAGSARPSRSLPSRLPPTMRNHLILVAVVSLLYPVGLALAAPDAAGFAVAEIATEEFGKSITRTDFERCTPRHLIRTRTQDGTSATRSVSSSTMPAC